MIQAIAGVAPGTQGEVTIMTVWPSLAATAGGRFWGRLYMNSLGVTIFGVPIRLGPIIALLSIPLILPPYFLMLLPSFFFIPRIGSFRGVNVANPWCRRYRLTNRRVIIEHGVTYVHQSSVSLDDFETIDVVVLRGQQWYKAAELVFRQGDVETFRLAGVPSPESFRATCLKAQRSHDLIQKAAPREPAAV